MRHCRSAVNDRVDSPALPGHPFRGLPTSCLVGGSRTGGSLDHRPHRCLLPTRRQSTRARPASRGRNTSSISAWQSAGISRQVDVGVKVKRLPRAAAERALETHGTRSLETRNEGSGDAEQGLRGKGGEMKLSGVAKSKVSGRYATMPQRRLGWRGGSGRS